MFFCEFKIIYKAKYKIECEIDAHVGFNDDGEMIVVLDCHNSELLDKIKD